MAPALLSGTNRGRGCVVRGLTSLYPPVSLIEQKSFLLSLSGVMCVRISGIQLPFPFSRACNLPVPVICSGCQPVSHTFFSQNDFFYDQPVRAQTVCSYRTDLDPFSPPFCLNVITLHLGECHYKLWGYNSVVSNECSIKQRAPTRQTGPNKANWMLFNWQPLFWISLKSWINSPWLFFKKEIFILPCWLWELFRQKTEALFIS